MKLVVIFGPAAVGKMTVGRALQDITDLKLFHNHMVLEPVYHFFGFEDEQLMRLTGEFRRRLFEEFGKSNIPGIIFTYVWALDEEEDHQEMLDYIKSMNLTMEDVFFVELQAEQQERLERNRSEFRLSEKKSKNNIDESERFLIQSEEIFQLNSTGNFFYPERHLKIDNTNLEPQEVARRIKTELDSRGFF